MVVLASLSIARGETSATATAATGTVYPAFAAVTTVYLLQSTCL